MWCEKYGSLRHAFTDVCGWEHADGWLGLPRSETFPAADKFLLFSDLIWLLLILSFRSATVQTSLLSPRPRYENFLFTQMELFTNCGDLPWMTQSSRYMYTGSFVISLGKLPRQLNIWIPSVLLKGQKKGFCTGSGMLLLWIGHISYTFGWIQYVKEPKNCPGYLGIELLRPQVPV